MQLRAQLASVLCLFLATVSYAQVILQGLSPASGVPGSTASIYGTGLQGAGQVQLGGVSAAVTLTTSTQVNFTVPMASSGFVAIQVAGVWYTNPIPFTVERPIQGTFNPPAGVSRTGYRVLTGGDFLNVDPFTGEFNSGVDQEGVPVLWAFRNGAAPAFIALVHPGTNQPVVDATSTAEALILLNPAVNAGALPRYTNYFGPLRALPEFNAFVTVIGNACAAGRDYLNDASVESAWVSTVEALLAVAPPDEAPVSGQGFEPGTPSGTKLRYLDPPETSQGNVGWRRLRATFAGPTPNRPDDFVAGFESAGRFQPFENPLDWFVKLYELDPAQFTDGLDSVSALSPTSNPVRQPFGTLQTVTVPATLFTKNLDLLDVAAGMVMDSLFARNVDPHVLKPNETTLPAVRPGVYVAEAHSGSLYYGTAFLSGADSQSQLITDLNARTTWAVSLGGNVFVAAVDLISGIGGVQELVKEFMGKDPGKEPALAKIMKGVAEDVVKGLAVHENDMASTDTLYDLLKTAASSFIKNLADLAMERAEFAGADEYGTKVAQTVGKSLNVLSKISTVAQGVERVTGLVNGGTLAVERTVIVVGNPFAPRITTFFPTTGRGGELMTIQGANFGNTTNGLSVSFRQFASTDDPTAYTKRLELEVLTNSNTSIAARVPWTNYAAEFPNGRAYVVVERGNTNFVGSSAALSPRFREFRFLLPPTITSVFPNPVVRGAMLELRGLGFDNETAREYEVKIDDALQSIGLTADGPGARMMFRVPPNLDPGAHEVAITLRGETSASFPFTVEYPAYETPHGESPGYGILVNQPDFSNVADGKISVQEAFLIIAGQLGRAIEQHPPCELLPPSEPDSCPPQDRETDFVHGDEPDTILGPVHTITFAGNQTITGALPPLPGGVHYQFGIGGESVILDGTDTAPGTAGLVLDGVNGVRVSGSLIIRNFSGPGVHLHNGAQNSLLQGISVVDCGSGFLVEGASTGNDFRDCSVTNVSGHGIHFTGNGTERNAMTSSRGGGLPPSPYTVITGCGGNGIRLDNGASFNNVVPGTIRNCQAAGIYVGGASNNFFGWPTEELRRRYDLVNNQTAGAHLGPGAVGNVLRYLNPLGNQGDGVLLQGPGCSNNVVDRTFAGVNLYEGGTSLTIANEGSGIRLTEGAQGNLIGTRLVSLGQHGSISGNRDDGVLLEGANTAFNTVNAQFIGVLDPYLGAAGLRFSANGRSGIALRNGTRDNTIGDHNADLANAVFACPDAGIELHGAGTDNNLVFGNQIGAFSSHWVLVEGSPNRPRIGIWIHNGPRNNTIGLPGARLIAPRFPGDTLGSFFQCWNAINSCTQAGVLIENASGIVGTDGVLSGANVIQANHIGELDNGNLAPSGEGAGLKLGAGAEANIIGGRTPELGNRIRGWYRAGVWIDQNHIAGPAQRNRIENNRIEGPGLGISFRYTDYLTSTPSGGVGVLLTDSSGHVIGESQLTRNTLYVNRLGVYLADSSSNIVQGCHITNSYNAGLVVRGGQGNVLGGDDPGRGNLIHAFGFRDEPNWAGLALSHTSHNRARNNEMGYLAPGRGAMGMYLTNAADNEIGGPARMHGNIVVANYTNGIVLSGPNSIGNRFFNNRIGLDRDGNLKSNRGDGVRLEAGASDNFIGGLAGVTRSVNNLSYSTSLPSGNLILGNEQAGVRVVGSSTVGNRILYNQISGNLGKGIQHEDGGNNLQPPPVFLAFDGKSVSGNVASLAVTPAGSRIQLFTDLDAGDPEGDAFLGEATVGPTGHWRASLVGSLRHPIITLTATHGGNGSTSEFATGDTTLVGFSLERADSTPQSSIHAGAVQSPVFLLRLKALNADVRVNSVTFDTTGTLPDQSAVTAARLYRDNDQNGVVTSADSLLAGPATFAADNGQLTFANMNPVIEANSTQQWVLAYSLSPTAPAGANFQLSLTNAQVVDAQFINPFALAVNPQGDFAILSAEFTVGDAPAGQTYATWAADVFTPTQLADPEISGPHEDPDGDGLNNFGEYAYNLNPLLPDRHVSSADRGVPAGSLAGNDLRITFVRRKPPVDLVYELDHAANLQSWSDALSPPAYLTLESQVEVGPPGTLERVTYRTVQPASEGRHYVRVLVKPAP